MVHANTDLGLFVGFFLLDFSLTLRDDDIKCRTARREGNRICPDGCQDKFSGDFCNMPCPVGCRKCDRSNRNCHYNCVNKRFGINCNFPCPHCSKRCDKSGNCLDEIAKSVQRTVTTINTMVILNFIKEKTTNPTPLMDNVRGVTQSTHRSSSKTPVGDVTQRAHRSSSKTPVGVPDVTQRAHRSSSKTPVGVPNVTQRAHSSSSKTLVEGVPDVMRAESTISLNEIVVMLAAIIIMVFVVLLVVCLAKYIYVLHTKKERTPQETAEQEPLSSGTVTSHTYEEIDEISTSVSGQRPFETQARQSNMATSALGHDIGPQNQSVSQTCRTLATGVPDVSSMCIHQARQSNMLMSGDLRGFGYDVCLHNQSVAQTRPTLSTATPDVSSMCINQERQSNGSTSSGYLRPGIQYQRTADHDACSMCIQPVVSLRDDAYDVVLHNQSVAQTRSTLSTATPDVSSMCIHQERRSNGSTSSGYLRPGISYQRTADHDACSICIQPVASLRDDATVFNQEEFKTQATIPNMWASPGCLRRLGPHPTLSTVAHSVSSMHAQADISDRVDFKSRATVANGSTSDRPTRCEGPLRRQQLRHNQHHQI